MRSLFLVAAGVLLAGPALARTAPPRSLSETLMPLAQVQEILLPAVDVQALQEEDEKQTREPTPPRFASPIGVDYDIDRDGTWDYLPGGERVWRMLFHSPGALSLNLAFSTFLLPEGATLHLHNPESGYIEGPFTAADNQAHGEFWSPLVLGDLVVVELALPAKVDFEPELSIMRVHHGYRFFGEQAEAGPDQGSCNNDVICPEGDPWRQEIRSEAVYTLNGGWTCSGQMMNSVPEDFRNYFLTANHCGVRSSNDHTIVVYWNFESPVCGMLSGGSLSDNQTGSTWRSGNSFSDFTLVELDDDPEPIWNVSYSGWDASGDIAPSCVAIHHPGTDEKAISFNVDPLLSESYLGDFPNDHSHWRVDEWEDGTTEPGSSGSGIWDPDHHLVGQLHGGYASCTSITSDWYGKFSESWDHGSSNTTRIKDWLDPYNTGDLVLDTSDPHPPVPVTGLVRVGSKDFCGTVSNGVWEPGERVYVGAELMAVNGDVTNVVGRLVALTEGVTVLTELATWPDIPVGETRITNPPYFLVELDEGLGCDELLEFRLDTQFDQGTATARFDEQVGSPGPALATVESSDVPKVIPDDNPVGVSSTLEFNPAGTVDRVVVGLALEHTYVGDLEVEVTSPQGTTITLLSRAGGSGCSDDDMRVLFDDLGAVDLNNHCSGSSPWFTGTGRPYEELAGLRGESVVGTWTLRVIDHAGIDTGSILRWGVRVFDAEGRICEVCTD